MTVQEQARASSGLSTHSAEWAARDLRPVARWVLVPGDAGSARLEMRWSVPDPTVGDAL